MWKSPEGNKVLTYTIVTTEANKTMSDLHDRMPVMLLKEEWDDRLNPENHDTKLLLDMLNPFPDDAIDYYYVAKEVGNVRNNSAELFEKVEPSE